MDQETVKKYVEEGGEACPFCGSENILGGDTQRDGHHFWLNVICSKCDREWTERYDLANIEEVG